MGTHRVLNACGEWHACMCTTYLHCTGRQTIPVFSAKNYSVQSVQEQAYIHLSRPSSGLMTKLRTMSPSYWYRVPSCAVKIVVHMPFSTCLKYSVCHVVLSASMRNRGAVAPCTPHLPQGAQPQANHSLRMHQLSPFKLNISPHGYKQGLSPCITY